MPAAPQLDSTRQLWLLILITTALRLVFAHTGYGMDESYAVATSREFHLSGYDHPPMAWWLSTLMQHLFHTTTPWLVRVPFVLLSAVATWQIYRLTERLFTRRAGFFAALAFCCAPALGVTDGTWVLPDGPLLVGLLAGSLCLVRLSGGNGRNGWWWLAVGFWGGVAILSKYHGVFFFFGAFLFVISQRNQWHWLRSPWPYLGVILGVAVFSPVLIWNIEHHFASFAFQGGRTGAMYVHPLKPLQVLLGQALFLTPWIWLGLVWSTYAALTAPTRHAQCGLLLCLALPMIVLFTLVSAIASGAILYHWAMPGYLFLLPLLGDWLARREVTRPRWVKRWVSASASIPVTALIAIMFLWYAPVTAQKLGIAPDPLAAMRPLTDVSAYLETHGLTQRTNLVVAPTKWHSTGQFDVALNGAITVTCFCADARQYSVLAPLSGMVGRDFLIPVPLKNADEARATYGPFFTHFERYDDLTLHQGGATQQGYAMFYGTALKPTITAAMGVTGGL